MVPGMSGGLAVSGNLLCIAFGDARGRVMLLDLDERHPVSLWPLDPADGGYSDAAGVALDHHYGLHIADTVNDRVRRYTAFGRRLEDLGRPQNPGEAGARRLDRAGTISRPRDVAVLSGDIYVVCGDRPLRRAVQRFRRDGTPLRSLPCAGDPELEWQKPMGIASDGAGIWVCETGRGRLLRYRADGSFEQHLDTSGPGRGATEPIRCAPVPREVSPTGGLLVVDQGERPGVHRFLASGEYRGIPKALQEAVEPPVLDAVCDHRGAAFVLDRDGGRVLAFRWVDHGQDLAFEEELVDLLDPPFADG